MLNPATTRRQHSSHSRQTGEEQHGKVIELSADKKSGLFLSPIRGPVLHDAVQNAFSPVNSGDSRLSRIANSGDTGTCCIRRCISAAFIAGPHWNDQGSERTLCRASGLRAASARHHVFLSGDHGCFSPQNRVSSEMGLILYPWFSPRATYSDGPMLDRQQINCTRSTVLRNCHEIT